MGFYGNITNTTKTSFSFDRIYPNRRDMEASIGDKNGDGVYIGRFVLVDYDAQDEYTKRVYYNEFEYIVSGQVYYYLFSDPDLEYKITFNPEGIIVNEDDLVTGINRNDLCYVENIVEFENGEEIKTRIYYQCYGADADGYALFVRFNENEVPEGSNRWNYAVNYNIDQNYYDSQTGGTIGRGWDSTVWQKVYEAGKEKYVMVAELNGVVPTFTLSADAPTINPITPHFDEVSNNTYYELHWQPQWGMRVKHARGAMSADTDRLLSDETTTWIQSVYNKDLKLQQYYYFGTDHNWHLVEINRQPDYTYTQLEPIDFAEVVEFVNNQKNSQLPAAIYYNKAGFNPAVHFSSSTNDKVQMTPTGYSAQPTKYEYYSYETSEGANGGVRASEWKITEYNDHERGTTSPQVDTQEWQMMLPSLGNAVSSMWDIIYGVGVDESGKPIYQYDEEGQIKVDGAGRPLGPKDKDYERLTFIDWVDGSATNDQNRLRLVHEKENGFTYDTKEVETLAGCINSVHDLMGMIIVDSSDIEINSPEYNRLVEQTDEDRIYYLSDGGYYRRGRGYEYTEMEYTYEEKSVTADEYQPNFYYYKQGEEYIADIENVFDSEKTYYIKKLLNPDEEYSEIELDSYEVGKYYYAAGDNYLVENHLTARNVTYYLFGGEDKLQKENLKDDFDYTLYYEKTESGVYRPASTETPELSEYYSVPKVKTPAATRVLEDPDLYDFETDTFQGETLTYFWVPGAFGIKNETGDGFQLTELDAEYNPELDYYLVRWKRERDNNTGTGEMTYKPETLKDETGRFLAYKVNLIQFEENRYYQAVNTEVEGIYEYIPLTKEVITKEYEDLGRARLNNLDYPDNYEPNLAKNYYYELNIETVFPQDMFYVPNKFYYIDENRNFLKDKSLKLVKDREYYTLLEDAFIETNNIFYKPNTFYYKDDVFYYLDKSFNKQDIQYYKKNYFYIKNDLEGLYSQGSQWNRGVEGIPCTIELAKREEVYEMKLLNGFARTFNTINGLIIEINKLLLSGDYHTRDRNTVQGCINLMNDIINRFQEDFEPRRLIVSDNYGRIQSVPIETNEWIDTDIIGKANEGLLRIEHMYPNKQDNTTDTIDKNGNGDIIELEKIIIDETGHVKNTHTDTVTLPYGYKTFIDDNDNQAVAENTQDTFIFKDDTWVTATISDKSLQIQHEYPNEPQAEYGQEEDKSPKFGQTFNTVFFDVDERGHIAHANQSVITLPKGSLSSDYTNDNPARVLTGIGFTASSGKISYSQDNIGNLKLTGYSLASSVEQIDTSDSINSAFGKLQRSINQTNEDLISNVNTLSKSISELDNRLTTEISLTESRLTGLINAVNNNLVQTAGQLRNEINNVSTSLGGRIDNLSDSMSGRINNLSDSVNGRFDNLSNKVDNNQTALTNSINTINETLNIINGGVDTTGSIKQQINALNIENYIKKTEAIGYDDILTKTLASTNYQSKETLDEDVKQLEFNYKEENKILQDIISDLLARIEVLEQYHQEEVTE